MSSEGSGAINEENKSVLVPRLRFPEFRGAGAWEEETLGTVCDMQPGKFVAASEISEKKADGLYPCFGGNGLRGYTKTYNQSGRYSLIGRQGALCGNVNLVDGDFYATEHAVVTTPKAGNSADWLFYNLCLLNLNRFATGQAQPGLSVEVLEKVACVVPKDKDEQQKIADCLSSLDELITAETHALTALKTHKKGLMQQLFPREGETVPRLRFPEFRGAGEWEEKTLDAVCVMQAGKFVAASEISDIQADGFFPCFGGNGLRGYTKTYNQSGRYSLIGRQGALCGNVNLVDGDFYATEHAVVTTPKRGISTDWLFYNLCLLNLNRFATGQAQPGLSVEVLGKVECVVPSDKDEQQKIADCLASLDDLITAQSQKIAALKTHKKGLMQQLFPVLDEVPA